ncbi:MAG: SH3 domain-containing protein [Candidatus Marinimicrobia bacterium]|nr:SH3 domain-containing protein [Candidatus Neomarinimicrobiota bacterium]MDD9888676.1 SH3 domain-containing protein [Candidatus Neomarinimicrobiota bacterium]MDD9931880.1 SH3 domain-containing protein [Candidatus Neomarinimicrobiota bacterium]
MNRIILTLCITFGWAQSPDSLYQLGNRYYEAERYQQAANTYEKLSRQVVHEDLFLNLGNAYFRMGELGHSIWAYEKGYDLSPRNGDLNYNLNFVRAQVRDRIIPPDDFIFVAIYRAIVEKLTILDLITLAGFLFIGLGCIYVLRVNGLIADRMGGIVNGFLLVFLLSTGWIMLDKYWEVSDEKEAIVIAAAVDVRSAPIERGENVVFRIHEGTKVDITATQAGWVEVILLDGKKGWMAAENVRTL